MSPRAIGALGIGQCVNWGVLYCAFAVLVRPLERELGVATWVVTGAFSLSLLMSAAPAPAIGRWGDRDRGALMMQAGGFGAAALLAPSPHSHHTAFLVESRRFPFRRRRYDRTNITRTLTRACSAIAGLLRFDAVVDLLRRSVEAWLLRTRDGSERLRMQQPAAAEEGQRLARTPALVLLLLSTSVAAASAQAQPAPAAPPQSATLAIHDMIVGVEKTLTGVATEMPDEKYEFAPTAGSFRGLRKFAEQIKHAAAVQFLVAASILNEPITADMSNERGPDSAKTKAEARWSNICG